MMSSNVYISRNEAAKLSGASPAVVNKAIEQKAVHTKKVRAGSAVDARDTGALLIFAALPFRLPVTLKRNVAAWVREAGTGSEFPLSETVIVRKTEAVDEAVQRALRYVELRDQFLEVNPEVQGGEPVIRDTRVPIRGLAKQLLAGETMDVLREEYDYIDRAAFEFAVMWANANPRRGRPARRRAGDRARAPRRGAGTPAPSRGDARVRFWANACVTPGLEGVAHARGYEATSNRTRGMLTASDPEQVQRFDEVIDYIEHRAADDREPPADWMVCRIVVCDDDGSISHGWLPESSWDGVRSPAAFLACAVRRGQVATHPVGAEALPGGLLVHGPVVTSPARRVSWE
jgi:uncharacterized protein (DUF433 family)